MTTHAFNTAASTVLEVRSLVGDVRVDASDRTDARVTVTAREERDREWEDRIRVTYEEGRLLIDEPRGRSGWRGRRGSVDVHVEVASGSDAEISAGAGAVACTGVLGVVRVSAGAGRVQLDTCASASVKAGAGDVEIGSVHDGATVKAGAGDITLRAVHGGELRLATGLGAIRCAIPEGVAARVDAKSGLGTIDNRLSDSDERPEARSYVAIHAKSGMGDIIIERAVGVLGVMHQ